MRLWADAGFADPELYICLEANEVAYAIGLGANARLQAKAHPLPHRACFRTRGHIPAHASPSGS
jgi:hypothetical protein